MRIGLVSAEFPPAVGGVGDHTARLALELARAGHVAEVVTSQSPSQPDSADVRVLRIVHRWDAWIWWQLPRLARHRRWDVLHIQYQPAAYGLHGAINVLPWFVWGPSPAVVTTFHDLRFPYLFPKAGPLRTAAVAALAKGSDATIAASDDDLPQLQRWRAGRPVDTTQHVPLGDQLDAAPPPDYSRESWRAKLGLSEDAPLIAYFGLINESKGVIDLVEALARLPGVRLVMIGEALGTSDATNRAYLTAVDARAAELDVGARIHWTGYVSPAELAGWLDAADLVALPYVDGASLRRTSLIAAWRRGKLVVTTAPRTPSGWSEAAGDVAVFVPPRDPTALADALSAALSDPGQRARFGAAGARFAERFSWRSVIEQTVAVYGAALSARRA